ncbi:hypothetical protein [Streptomyces sp. HUAS TT7]
MVASGCEVWGGAAGVARALRPDAEARGAGWAVEAEGWVGAC